MNRRDSDFLPSRWAELADGVPTVPWPIPVDPRNAPDDMHDFVGSGAGAVRVVSVMLALLAITGVAWWLL
jgi:hypothetical protein